MRHAPLSRRSWLGIIGLLLGIGLACPAWFAPRTTVGASGTPVPPGTIYYLNASAGTYWSMKGDGSSKLKVSSGRPSCLRHAASRWFLQNRTVDAALPDQWVAVNDAGQIVPLTNDPNLHWNGYPPSWSRDDAFFSYVCVYQTDTEWIGQLFTVDVDWSSGTPVAGIPTVAYELRRSVFDEFGNFSYEGYDEVNLGRHDWAPNGTDLALTRWVWGEGWVIDIVLFTTDSYASYRLASEAANPEYAPDGSRIAYNRLHLTSSQDVTDIWTIHLDGTGAVQLTKYVAGKGSNGTGQRIPTWSPDGAYLAYYEQVVSGNKITNNIRRIPAAGGTAASLTSDGTSSAPCWRP